MTFGYTATMSRRKPESDDGFGKLTLSIPEVVIHDAKVLAVQLRTSLSNEVTEWLREFIATGGANRVTSDSSQEQPGKTTDPAATYNANATDTEG